MNLPVLNSPGPSRRGTHRLIDFDRCPQRFAYKYVLRLMPVSEPGGRGLGTLLHIGLEQRYLRLADRPHLDPIEAMRRAPARLAVSYEKARALYLAYAEYWHDDWERFTVLDVENEIAVKVGGHLHTQKFDLIVKTPAERVVVYDHKTTSGDVSSHWREWGIARQFISATMIMQAVCEEKYGLPFGGIEINTIGTRQPFEFDRHEIHVAPEHVKHGALGIRDTNDRIESLLSARDPWLYHRTYACQGRYGMCEYLDLCERGKDALGAYVAAEDEGTDAGRVG